MRSLAESHTNNTPRLTLADLRLEWLGDPEEVHEKELNEYLSQFARLENSKCPSCQQELRYHPKIHRGESHCIVCEHPIRVFHYGLPGCNPVVELALAYHPDEVAKRKQVNAHLRN